MASCRHGAHVAVDRVAIGDDGARALLVSAGIDAFFGEEVKDRIEDQALDDPGVLERIQYLDEVTPRGGPPDSRTLIRAPISAKT